MTTGATFGHAGTRCRIKSGWSDAGREGVAFNYFDDLKGQRWVALQWDGDDDPDLHKAMGIEVKTRTDVNWRDISR